MTRLSAARFALSLPLILFASAYQSQAPVPIQGIVVQSGTNIPLGKAIVELRGPGAAETITDSEGRFFFPSVQPGTYRLSATRDGHVKTEYGQRQWGGPALSLSVRAGQPPEVIRLSMDRGAVISGRVSDRGRPAGAAEVVALKASYNEGQRVMFYVLTTRTNDLGEYHLLWLPPGQYYVAAVVSDSIPDKPSEVFINPDGNADIAGGGGTLFAERRTWRAGLVGRNIATEINDDEMHVPMYFPGVPDFQSASLVEVRAGSDARSIDIAANPVTPRRIKGVVTGIPRAANGQPAKAMVRAALLNTSTNAGYNVETDANGFFEIPGVRPWSYLLTATAGTLSSSTTLDTRGSRDADVVLSLIPGLELNGRLTVEQQAGSPALPALSVMLRHDPLVPGSPTYNVAVKPDGTFRLPATPLVPAGAVVAGGGIAPSIRAGDYRVFVSSILQPPPAAGTTRPAVPVALQNAYVKSIRLGGEDVLNGGLRLRSQPQDGLEIVVGDNPGTLEGRVMNAAGQPVPAIWVALVPESGLKFRIEHKYASTDASGQFRIQNAPPGDYLLYAWEAIERGDWQLPEAMRKYEGRGAPVRINEGARSTVEVVAIPSN